MRLLVIAVLAIGVSSCETDRALKRASEAAGKAAEASGTSRALEVAQQASRAPLPPLPSYCRESERTGVQEADGADIALVKSDRAVGRANARTEACARWYDKTAEARQ